MGAKRLLLTLRGAVPRSSHTHNLTRVPFFISKCYPYETGSSLIDQKWCLASLHTDEDKNRPPPRPACPDLRSVSRSSEHKTVHDMGHIHLRSSVTLTDSGSDCAKIDLGTKVGTSGLDTNLPPQCCVPLSCTLNAYVNGQVASPQLESQLLFYQVPNLSSYSHNHTIGFFLRFNPDTKGLYSDRKCQHSSKALKPKGTLKEMLKNRVSSVACPLPEGTPAPEGIQTHSG